MFKKVVIYLAISLFCLTSCSDEAPSDPACRVSQAEIPERSGHAACVIRLGDKLLTITHRLSGKFDVPGGTQSADESAKCTAHRETWEETGFNVEVEQWLGTNSQSMHFYACTLAGNFDDSITQFPVPFWANPEVKSIQLVDPFITTDKQWRFPEELVPLRAMFNQVPDSINHNQTPAEE